MDIESLVEKSNFPASQKMTYLNAASVALMYVEASRAVLAWQQDIAENGTNNFDEKAEEDIYNDLHAATAELFNVGPADIAVGSSTTELMSSLAWAIFPENGKNIIGTTASFPSTIYPWQRLSRKTGCEIRLVEGGSNGYIDPVHILEQIDDKTAVVCLSMVEYRSGQLYNLKEISSTVHEHGGLLVVDATQAAGQVPIDARSLGLDAIISSGYKWLCGPFGAAVMYIAPDLQLKLDPGTVGWRSHEIMWDFRADRLVFPANAKRFEAGTMAYGCAIALARAVEYLNRIGIDRILRHNKNIADKLGSEFTRIGAEIVSPERDEERSSIISVKFPGTDARLIANHLYSKNIVVSERVGVIRISPHLYNDENDVDRIIEVAKEFRANG
ncbi:MAG: aminotransferase class V-fold PLP-dependent enzyme [Anaerolineaceae bacterium]|nr:aminotransferase class V-fold PLP-dependent enzyme [Anaerolineaceae bacterium]